jgi:hypothetical protein
VGATDSAAAPSGQQRFGQQQLLRLSSLEREHSFTPTASGDPDARSTRQSVTTALERMDAGMLGLSARPVKLRGSTDPHLTGSSMLPIIHAPGEKPQ